MTEKNDLIIGGVLYLIWCVLGAWTLYDEIMHPYIPEHGFLLALGIMPFAAPIIIFIASLLDKEEPKPL